MTTHLFGPPGSSRRDWAIALAGMLGTVVFTHVLYGGFFPGPNGVGHDYSGGMTGFLAEYYWSLSEGPWVPPWFTPAFCGGIPLYADPVNPFFSLPGFLMRFGHINPLISAYITFLISVGVGFLGAFFFVRRRLEGSIAAALLAALVFGLNGFLSSRMLIGHGMYHGVMLIPALALWLTDGGPSAISHRRRTWIVSLSALAIAYWVYSGGGVLMMAFALATLLLIGLAWLRGSSIPETMLRGTLAAGLAFVLSASKINAALSYMASFPRSGYLLPGYTSAFETIQVIFASLFTSGVNIAQYSQERLTNVQWFQDRHELEYGVTVVPLVLLGLALVFKLLRPDPLAVVSQPEISTSQRTPNDRARPLLILLAMGTVMAIPVALNTYGEAWNAFLKSLPLIGSSSALMRWFVVYVPLVAVLGGLAVDRIMPDEQRRWFLTSLAALGVLIVLGATDRGFYKGQSYDPQPVIEAFEAVKKNPEALPKVRFIGAFVDSRGRLELTLDRQDLMIRGVSQLACYIPIFGYRLEHFPARTLRPGSIFAIDGEGFNMKNPACFVFPKENHCKVGDHFPVSRRSDLERFANYGRFPFEKSARQKFADVISLLALAFIVGSGLWVAAARLRQMTT